MVPVLASNDEGRSRAALSLLEAHGIPALLDADLEGGAFVGFHDPVPEGWSQVLVPISMRANALEVLRNYEGEGAARRSRPASAFEVPRPGTRGLRSPTPMNAELGLRALQRGVSYGSDPEHDVPGLAPGEVLDDGLRGADLPEPSPLTGRLTTALSAIAFGGAMQQLLSWWKGPETLLAQLAARSGHWDELHRLVTASFLHGGPGHFLSNAGFGLVFGAVLFGTHGVGAAALVWLLSSAVGLSAEVGMSSAALVIGASAGNYGLVGLWARGQLERSRVAVLPRRERLKTIGVLLLLLPGALTPFSSTGTRIAVLAHVAGFMTGYLLGFVFPRRLLSQDLDRLEDRSRLAGLVAVVIAAAGWVVGLGHLL